MKRTGHRALSQGAAYNHHRFKTHSGFVPTRRRFLHHAVSKPPRPRLRVALQPYRHVAAVLPIRSEVIEVTRSEVISEGAQRSSWCNAGVKMAGCSRV